MNNDSFNPFLFAYQMRQMQQRMPAMPWPCVQKASFSAGQVTKNSQPKKEAAAPISAPSSPLNQQKTTTQATSARHFADRTYSADAISAGDLERIVNLCGTNNIEEIYDVTSMQTMMIRRMRKIKDSYVLQFMIRTKLKMDPIVFREQVDEACEKLDNLRSVYIYRDMDKPYRVVLKNRTADVGFIDLSDQLDGASPEKLSEKLEELMEADRRNGFDLERNSLLRIMIYKLDRDDTYALLFSQPHVNSDGISVSMLIRDVFIAYGLKMSQGIALPIENSSFKEYAEYLKSIDKEKELAYWKAYLDGFGKEICLPGYVPNNLDYELNLLFQPFKEDTVKALRGLQKTCKATFATIIQAVWAILLARLAKSEDVIFGSVTAGRDSAVANSMQISGGFINTLLLRSRLEDSTPFVEAVQKLQDDYQHAMEYSHCSPEEIRGSIHRKDALINHILNFHNYNSGKRAGPSSAQPQLPGVEVLGMDVYDNLSYDLALYFKENDVGQYGCTFAYNAKTYSRETIQLIGEYFSRYLDLTAESAGTFSVGEYPEPDFVMFALTQQALSMERYKKAAFLKTIPALQGVDDAALMRFAEDASVCSFMRGDRISVEEERSDSIFIVMDGFIDLSMLGHDGWIRKISIEGIGNLLPFTSITRDMPRITVTAASETATILKVPAENMKQLLSAHPEVGMQIIRLLEKKWLNYGRLWAAIE